MHGDIGQYPKTYYEGDLMRCYTRPGCVATTKVRTF